jgi:putative integral membrane protein (TIGR02587 family)
MADKPSPESEHTPRDTAIAYGRGAAGGMIIALPMLMTMEMWWGGFTMSGGRLLALLVVNFGVLLVLQHYSGLHPKKTRGSQFRAALVAYGIGIIVSIATLEIINVLRGGIALVDIVGKLVLEAVPVSLGASIAMSHFGVEHDTVEERKDEDNFWAQRAMALAGAMIFGISLAATEEMTMIGLQLTWAHALALALLSIFQVHAIVYAVGFKNHESDGAQRPTLPRVLSEAVGVYAIAIALSTYLLWTFGQIGADTGLHAAVDIIVTLGFATSLGAAAAELLI